MQTKAEIMREIDRLKSASPSMGREAFAPLIKAVEAYFTPDAELKRHDTFYVS